RSLQNEYFGAVSSVGRAPARQAGGHWFEPSTAHFWNPPETAGFVVFSGCSVGAEEVLVMGSTSRRLPLSTPSGGWLASTGWRSYGSTPAVDPTSTRLRGRACFASRCVRAGGRGVEAVHVYADGRERPRARAAGGGSSYGRRATSSWNW